MIKTTITDGKGTGLKMSVLKRNGWNAIPVLTDPIRTGIAAGRPYLNDTYGVNMNQNVTFGGVGNRATILHAGVNSGNAESGTTDGATTDKLIQSGQNFETTIGPGALVHNTTDDTYAIVTAVDSDTQLTLDTDIMESGEDYTINAIWVGTAVAGIWNFADSGKISLTSASNDDEATFTVNAASIWNAQYFTAFTGKVDLTAYNEVQNSIIIEFGIDGVLVGNTINLNDYIDTGSIAEQSFVIPKEDLGLANQNINSMRIITTRNGGSAPTITFDDLQLESTGSPATFIVKAEKGTTLHITKLVFAWADTGTAGTAYAYDQIGAIASLTNGIVLTTTSGGETIFTATFRNLGDLLNTGGVVDTKVDDGTDTYVNIGVSLFETKPVILDSREDDEFSITINDDLSGLILFKAFARGWTEELETE